MKAKLIIDNKEIEVNLKDEDLKRFIEESTKKTGYEIPSDDRSMIYWEDTIGTVSSRPKHRLMSMLASNNESRIMHDDLYKSANYYSSREVASNNARADQLMRQLRRYSVEHRHKDIDWTTHNSKYNIVYDHVKHRLILCEHATSQYAGTIHFDSYEVAQNAINEFHEGLIWYFTEYKDSL